MRHVSIISLAALVSLTLGFAQASIAQGPAVKAPQPQMMKSASGLQWQDLVVGSGPTPRRGSKVNVHYTGWLTNGQKFDSSLDRGQPFCFTLGAHQVIAGWDEGVATMHVGGKRKLVIPPQLGYGAGGMPPVIPPNSTLVFEVQLLGVEQ